MEAAPADPTVVVRSGRAGPCADWRTAPGVLRAWQQQALCRELDGDVFFPDEDESPDARDRRERIAKAICTACLVRPSCAVHALANRELHGVWGGLSEADRRRRFAHL